MAVSISWGLVFATTLTLIIIPCIYSVLDELSMKIMHRSSMILPQKQENGDKDLYRKMNR
jgi:hypothetical protein